ncbi:MAG: MBL fold metallo-hydrolase, partial [Coriobacteriales bacterium]|nr:MBL fold metallo-hydrolase [Coriobacteriales bacterium]
MHKVTPSVLSTSVLNPNMRTFDIVMRTEYGTSYNSYVVIGADKVALIEASHATFAANYLENVEEALAGRVPDYLVLNHCEPDHTGCVDALLDRYPGLTVVVSQAGSIYIREISNRPALLLQVAKDGDTLDLGGKTLHFISAPFLHWPDSMFTWLPEERVLFTCDFLGTHYCEPQMFDCKVVYDDAYRDAVRNYFEGIFEPFKPFVLKGLEKMEGLDVEFACTSHGPILTRGCMLEEVKADYLRWASPEVRFNKLIPVFYVSAYGNTQLLAEAAARGVL